MPRPEPDDGRAVLAVTLILAILFAAALALAAAVTVLAVLPAWRTAAELAACDATCVETNLEN